MINLLKRLWLRIIYKWTQFETEADKGCIAVCCYMIDNKKIFMGKHTLLKPKKALNERGQ